MDELVHRAVVLGDEAADLKGWLKLVSGLAGHLQPVVVVWAVLGVR